MSRDRTVFVISYSYPPDSVPAAHRPYELAKQLKASGTRFRIYTRHGVLSGETDFPAAGEPPKRVLTKSSKTGRAGRSVLRVFERGFEADKASPWAIGATIRLWWDLIRYRIKHRRRPIVWATVPLASNMYIATVAGFLSRSDVHLDFRDAVCGIKGPPMPLLTRLALRHAKTVSAVTNSLQEMIRESQPGVDPVVVFNGVSASAVRAALERWPVVRNRGQRRLLRVTYTGALYDGLRPIDLALERLEQCVPLLTDFDGIELLVVGREESGSDGVTARGSGLEVDIRGEVTKGEALELLACSDVNLVLVGSARNHRTAIPLKVFDCLGVGRPILFVGPLDSDACRFLQETAGQTHLTIDSESDDYDQSTRLATWLEDAAMKPSSVVAKPRADSQSRRIMSLLGVGAE